MSLNRSELFNTYLTGVLTVLMILKTEWVSNPLLRNKLGYIDIGVIGL